MDSKLTTMEITDWVQNWYSDQCDGEWEQQYGIMIETLDNPGWNLKVDLEGTNISIPNEEWKQVERSERDWYGYKVENGIFEASGDPSKLVFLLHLFKEKVTRAQAG